MDHELASVTTRLELAALLRVVHLRADHPSLRELEIRTRDAPVRLSRSTTSDMLAGRRFPRKAVLLVFLGQCGISGTAPWERAWERVATTEGPPANTDVQAVRQQCAGLLEAARRQADEIVADARRQAEAIVAAARENRSSYESAPPAEATKDPVSVRRSIAEIRRQNPLVYATPAALGKTFGKSREYHRQGCRRTENVKLTAVTLSEARVKGLRRCPECRPDGAPAQHAEHGGVEPERS
ncbi:hypothetical protein [Streptomyces sp. Root1310]|uniref:hypothetical protein n=1 Tax=Streptomyces sp. Root1310 TaxID=1736452 RepID=UPI0012FE93C7|nr:hypothetical protein [Streptomyces sp. Root1310]